MDLGLSITVSRQLQERLISGGGAVSCASSRASVAANTLVARGLRTHCIGGCTLRIGHRRPDLPEKPPGCPRNAGPLTFGLVARRSDPSHCRAAPPGFPVVVPLRTVRKSLHYAIVRLCLEVLLSGLTPRRSLMPCFMPAGLSWRWRPDH